MCAYSDSVADLHLFDAVVWGISPQDLDSHQSFAEGRRLKMPLLCDVDREVARAYGVLGPMGLRRSVFVVDAAYIDAASIRVISIAAKRLRFMDRTLTFRSPSECAVDLLATFGFADQIEPERIAGPSRH